MSRVEKKYTHLFCFLFVTGLYLALVRAAFAQIVINEIGAFEKSGSEWIEIYNAGEKSVDITDWKFYEDTTNHGLAAVKGDLIIEPEEYAIIAQKGDVFISEKNFSGTVIDSSWSSLKESGEEIGLKDNKGNFVELFTYIAALNFSLERKNPQLFDYSENNWRENVSGHTAGSQNSIFKASPSSPHPPTPAPTPTHAPTPIITPMPAPIISSNPTPQPTPVYSPSPHNSPQDTPLPLLTAHINTPSPLLTLSPSPLAQQSFPDIFISEFLPDPLGDDTLYEFITLYNPNEEVIDLSGWKLDDANEGSKPYTIPQGALIQPRQSLSFLSSTTKISLKNSSDIVRLLRTDGSVAQEALFEDAKEGIKFTRTQKGTWEAENKNNTSQKKSSPSKVFSIEAVHTMEIGSKVRIEGAVLALPDVFGSQFFYIADESGGIQIYMNKKEWPELKEGYKIQVRGIRTENRGEPRVKIANTSDIQVIQQENPSSPRVFLLSEAQTLPHGIFAQTKGEVTEKKDYGFFLSDGASELFITMKESAGITQKILIGDMMTVTGVLLQTGSKTTLLPRRNDDIHIAKVLSETLEPPNISQDKKKKGIGRYILFGAVAVVAAFFAARLRRARK